MDLSEILIAEVQKRPALWNLRGKAYHNRIIVDRDWKKVAEMTGLTVGASKIRWKNLRDHFRKELLKLHRANAEGGGEQRTSKWIHFDSLLFLKHVLKPRRSKARPPVVAEDIPEANPSPETEVAAINAAASVDNNDLGDYEFAHATDIEAKDQIAMAARPQTPTTFDLTEMTANRKCKQEPESKDSGVPESPCALESQLLKIESDKLSLLQSLEDDDFNFLKSLLPYMKALPPIRKLMIRSQFQNLLVQEMISLQNNSSTMNTPSNSGVQLSPGTISSPSRD